MYYFATFKNNNIEHNTASKGAGQSGGGGLYIWRGEGVKLEANRILSNTASATGEGVGGAILGNSKIVLTMTNNLLAGNHARTKAGGIYLDGWDPSRGIAATLINNTFANNDAGAAGEALYITVYVSMTLTNNILAGHTVGITNTNPTLSPISAKNNLFWNGTDPIIGTNAVLQDPLLLPFPNYHLVGASPAINKGLPTWVTNDIDGDPRPDWCFFDIGMDEHMTGKGCEDIFLPLVRR